MAPKKVQPQGAQTLEQVEAKFAAQSNLFYEKCMDLNTPQSTVANSLDVLMKTRSTLLGLYGVAPDPKWTGSITAPTGAGGAGVPGTPVIWSQKLHECLSKKAARVMTKGEIIFNTTAVDETNKSFVSTLSAPTLLSAEYSSEGPCISKAAAQHSAAMVAMQEEFAEVYAQLVGPYAPTAAAKGQKRKGGPDGAPVASAGPPEGKSMLSHFVQLLLGRPVAKEDMVYESVQLEGGAGFQATVALPTYVGGKSYQGAVAPTKKEAEMAAAKLACAQLRNVVVVLEEEHKAKKAKKNAEAIVKMKKMHEDRKAAAATAS